MNVKSANDLKQILNSGEISGVYVFFGEEDFTKQHSVKEFVKFIESEGGSDLNCGVIHGNDVSALLGTAELLPVFAPHRLIIVEDPQWKASGEFYKALNALLKDFPEYLALIITVPAARDIEDQRKGVFNTLEKNGVRFFEFKREGEQRLRAWIKKHIAGLSGGRLTISDGACGLLMRFCGLDMTLLSGEIKKLAFLKDGGEISEADVRLTVFENAELKAFEMSNALLAGRYDRALGVYGLMRKNREEPLAILGGIAGTMSDLLLVMENAGAGAAALSRTFGIHEYRVKLLSEAAGKTGRETVLQALELCRLTDEKIKSTDIDPYLLIEMMLLKLINPF